MRPTRITDYAPWVVHGEVRFPAFFLLVLAPLATLVLAGCFGPFEMAVSVLNGTPQDSDFHVVIRSPSGEILFNRSGQVDAHDGGVIGEVRMRSGDYDVNATAGNRTASERLWIGNGHSLAINIEVDEVRFHVRK